MLDLDYDRKAIGMTELPRIECTMTFLTEREGGRSSCPTRLSGNVYRPHLVVGDPRQRVSIVDRDGRSTEDYLGVAFKDGPEAVVAGEEITVTLVLMFAPHPGYDKLKPGAPFTVREGGQVVAFGTVQRILSTS